MFGAARKTQGPCNEGGRQTQEPVILFRKRRASSVSCEERWVCVGRHRDVSAEAAEASGARRGTKSGTSFPEKLAAGFLGGLAAQDVDTTQAYGSQLIVLLRIMSCGSGKLQGAGVWACGSFPTLRSVGEASCAD